MKAKRLIPPLLLLLTLSGCSGRSEVRDKGFIRTIGADCNDVQTISLQLYGSDEVLTGQGTTLFSAIADSERTQGKNLFAGHLELFAASPENIYKNLSSLLQNNRISPSCSVICVPENAAGLVAESESDFLPEIIDSSSRSGIIVKKNISSVIDDLLGVDCKAAVPVYKDGEIYMSVINGEKLIGILSRDESKGLCWLNGGIKDIYLPLDINGRNVDFYVRKSSTKITAEKQDDKINITVEIKINGNAEENDIDRESVKKNVAEQISGLCAKTIAKTVTGMKADVFGIEKSINARGISENRTWEDLIPNLNFYYKIKISE